MRRARRLFLTAIPAFFLALAIAPSASSQDTTQPAWPSARTALERCALAVMNVSYITYDATLRGEGSREGNIIEADASVMVERKIASPAGARILLESMTTKMAATGAKPEKERVSIDGTNVFSQDAATGRINNMGVYGEGGETGTGFASLVWKNFDWNKEEPFEDDLKGPKLVRLDDQEFEGEQCYVIRVERESGDHTEYWIANRDWLPRKYISRSTEDDGVTVIELRNIKQPARIRAADFNLWKETP